MHYWAVAYARCGSKPARSAQPAIQCQGRAEFFADSTELAEVLPTLASIKWGHSGPPVCAYAYSGAKYAPHVVVS
jgi:hypothetical protein